ncbi:MAG: hypothetical protein NTY19_05795 [Planctomycetota bacterium]|nr:hypothetical protein [Planctomycetota bacterium]
MHVHVMNRDGSDARDLSTNTLTDFGLTILQDGRLLFTRWEYVDVTLTYRQSLWTQYPDGRQFQLYFGNTIIDPATFWQAREIPGRDALVCTLAPHHHSPYGAIGLVKNRFGQEAPRDVGFRWITQEFPAVLDMNLFWAYRDPYPVGENRFLVSYGGGGVNRYRLYLLDDLDNKQLIYDDPATSCFYSQLLRPRPLPATVPDLVHRAHVDTLHVPAAPPGQLADADVPLGRFIVSDVYHGLEPAVRRGRIKYLRIMEQLPKTVNRTWYTVPLEDLRRIHEWIDAMIPYYPTTDYARREAQSNRDKWAHPDRKDLLDWFTKGFAPVYDRRCGACHGNTNEQGLPSVRQGAWIDLTKPEWSPALTAHLAKAANGRGIAAQGFEFASTADPDYQALLAAIVEGRP